jgi:hypothetical protein
LLGVLEEQISIVEKDPKADPQAHTTYGAGLSSSIRPAEPSEVDEDANEPLDRLLGEAAARVDARAANRGIAAGNGGFAKIRGRRAAGVLRVRSVRR